MAVIDKVKVAFREWLGVSDKDQVKSNAYHGSGTYNHIFTVSYDGEKNVGEMGPIKNYQPDHFALRFRSWQAFIESEIAQTVLKKFTKWVIGSGLKVQAEPVKKVLESEGISINTEEFNEAVEARFSVFAKSKNCDYSGMRNLHSLANRAFLHSKVGGDILIILRYIDGQVKVQLVDGAHLTSPVIGSNYYKDANELGNKIYHGVEISKTGEHVAFFVKKGMFDVERIPAKSKDTGIKTAFLIYGFEYRMDNHRGLPLLSAVLETLKKLERYKEATLGSAEERQKIVYYIVHGLGSTGETHLSKQIVHSFNADRVDDTAIDAAGKAAADTFAATTNKQAINMPKDSDLKSLDSKNELYFKDFYQVLGNLICASVNMPPDVAFSKYDSNFSASRAALKDWEHTLTVERVEFSSNFYQNVYDFWLHIQILLNKIQAPGYLKAWADGNTVVLDAYRNTRFVGASVPHIDPKKEVDAERAKLGAMGATIPLTTVEAATEALNGGDSDQNLQQFSQEMKEAKKLGVMPPPKKDPVKP